MKTRSQPRHLVLFCVIALLITLFLLFIDEGAYQIRFQDYSKGDIMATFGLFVSFFLGQFTFYRIQIWRKERLRLWLAVFPGLLLGFIYYLSFLALIGLSLKLIEAF